MEKVGLQLTAVAIGALVLLAALACTQEVIKEVPVTEVVTQEVVREVPVEKIVEVEKETIRTVEVERPVEVVKEVVKEVQVPGETVVVEKEVVREVQVPGETVVVEKEVVREVMVPGKTVEVEKQVIVTVVATPTPAPQFGSINIAMASIGFPIMAPGKLGCIPQDALHQWSVYDTTLYYGFDSPSIESIGIAESWEYDASRKNLTFRIRDGVSYHSNWGTVTAEDWKWSWDQQHIDGSLHSNIFVSKEFTKDVVVVDPMTVRHELTDVNDLYLDKFIGAGGCGAFTIFSRNRIDTLGDKAETDMSGGHGPYKFVTFDTGNKLVVEAAPEHYRKRGEYKLVNVLEIPEAAVQVAALMTGEVDATVIPTNEIERIRDRGMKVLVLKGDGPAHIVFQGRFCYGPLGANDGKGNPVPDRAGYEPERPWIGDCTDEASSENARKVREAVSLAIDRQSILLNILAGLGRMPTKSTWLLGAAMDQFAPLNPDWAWPTNVEANRDMARQLLAEAGWPNGFDVKMRITTDHHPSAVEIGGAIAKDLKTIGVNVQLEPIAYAANRVKVVERAHSDWWLWVERTGAPSLAYPRPESGKIRRVPGAAFNPGFEIPVAIDLAKALDACGLDQECLDQGRQAMYAWWANEHQMTPVIWSWGAIGVNPDKVGLWPQPTGIPTLANMFSVEYLQKP